MPLPQFVDARSQLFVISNPIRIRWELLLTNKFAAMPTRVITTAIKTATVHSMMDRAWRTKLQQQGHGGCANPRGGGGGGERRRGWQEEWQGYCNQYITG